MRKDMSKILVTAPRIGSSWKNYQVKKERRAFRDGDFNLPTYSSMKPRLYRTSYERKSLNEYLKPLARYLSKNTGRVWDQVYSDICKNVDKRTPVQNHIFSHLFDYVELSPHFIGETPHYPRAGVYFGSEPYAKMYKNGWTFYVDRSGILREPNEIDFRFKKKRPSCEGVIFSKDKYRVYIKRKTDAVWFDVRFVQSNDCDGIPDWIRDKIFNTKIWIELSGRKAVIKTMSKKEKKKVIYAK
tara:strand:- start:360 stop:1085 length:726 start_codon:yes stop_codon:yes gene_type:complete